MKILLKATVQGVGRAGEVRVVPDGYARNYLIPRNLGVPATPDAVQRVEQRVAADRQAAEADQVEQNRAAEQLSNQTVTIAAKASDQGRLFGSVGSAQVIEVINTKFQLRLSDKVLKLGRPISQVGQHQLKLKLGSKIVTMNLTITAQA